MVRQLLASKAPLRPSFDRLAASFATLARPPCSLTHASPPPRSLPQVLLDTQYRMSPLISAFASSTFYSSRLRDGANVLDPSRAPPYLRDNRDMLALADRGDHGDNEKEEGEEADGLWGGYKRPRRAVDHGHYDDDDGSTGSRELVQLMVFNLLSSRDSSSASASSSYSSTVVAAASSFAGAVASASAMWGQTSEPSQGASSEPSQNTTASTSLSNVEEATLCVRLLQVTLTRFVHTSKHAATSSTAITTPAHLIVRCDTRCRAARR